MVMRLHRMTPANRIRGGAGPKTKTKAKRSRARSSSVSSWDSEAAANESSSSSIADSDDDNIPRGRDCDEDDDDVEDMIWEYHPSDEPKVVMSGNGRTPIVQKGWWRFEFRYSTLDVLKADGLLERGEFTSSARMVDSRDDGVGRSSREKIGLGESRLDLIE